MSLQDLKTQMAILARNYDLMDDDLARGVLQARMDNLQKSIDKEAPSALELELVAAGEVFATENGQALREYRAAKNTSIVVMYLSDAGVMVRTATKLLERKGGGGRGGKRSGRVTAEYFDKDAVSMGVFPSAIDAVRAHSGDAAKSTTKVNAKDYLAKAGITRRIISA